MYRRPSIHSSFCPISTAPTMKRQPFKFTSTMHSVTVDVSGELIHDPEAELRVHMARQ